MSFKSKPKIALSAKKPIKLEDKQLGFLAFGKLEAARVAKDKEITYVENPKIFKIFKTAPLEYFYTEIKVEDKT